MEPIQGRTVAGLSLVGVIVLLRWDPSVNVGGPISKGRAFVLGSLERIWEARSRPRPQAMVRFPFIRGDGCLCGERGENRHIRKGRSASRGTLVCTLALLSFLVSGTVAAWSVPNQKQIPNQEPLKELSLEQLGSIEVTSASKEPEEVWRTPAAVYVLTQDDIRRSGATSIPDILRLVPGVEVSQIDSDKWAVGIRGFESRLARAVLVLIDGRSVYTPLFAGVYWEQQFTLLEDIDRIEVIRGPGGTVWGANAVNGVINIITKHARDTRGVLVSAGGGNVVQGRAGARYGAGDDRFSYRIYGTGSTLGPEFHPTGNQFDDWREGQFGFRTDATLNDRDSLTVQGDVYRVVAGSQVSLSFFSPPSIINAERNADVWGGNVITHWSRKLQGGSDLQLQVYYDRTDRYDLNYREIRNTFDADFIHHIAAKRQDFVWGLGVRVSPSNFIQTSPTVDFEPHHEDYNIFSGFLQDEIRIMPDRLSFIVGAKLEHNSYSGFEIQPSGRLLWQPSKHQTFWAAVSRSVRTPSRIEDNFQLSALAVPATPLYVRLIGDGNFVSEKMLGFELGYRTAVTPKFFFDLSTFYNAYDDLLSVEAHPPAVEPTPPPPHLVLPLFLRNGVKAETTGFEIAPVWQVTHAWQLKGAYSYMHLDARDKPGSVDASTAKQLEGDSPRHQLSVWSNLTLSTKVDVDLIYRYVSGILDQKVGGYSTADARLAWRPAPKIELSLNGRNLLQPYHFEYSGDPGGQVGIKRSIFAGITWRK